MHTNREAQQANGKHSSIYLSLPGLHFTGDGNITAQILAIFPAQVCIIRTIYRGLILACMGKVCYSLASS